jgi:hypothetical protein
LAILVILVLAILWGAVLLPPILRSREGAGRPSGVADIFDRLRDGLGRARSSDPSLPALQPIMGPIGSGSPGSPASPMGPVRVPGGMTPAQRRRRDVLVGLIAASGLTFLMALFAGNLPFWFMHLLADGLLGGYVFLLLQFKARAAQSAPRPVNLGMPMPMEGALPNVHDLAARRFPPATANVDAPREATVLALRRSASW